MAFTPQTPVTDELARQVLEFAVVSDTAEFTGTVREYLLELLSGYWSGVIDLQYGLGEGSLRWRYDLYRALRHAGLIPAWVESSGLGWRGDDIAHPEDKERADQIIDRAIRQLGATH